jgi:hypothetical protein
MHNNELSTPFERSTHSAMTFAEGLYADYTVKYKLIPVLEQVKNMRENKEQQHLLSDPSFKQAEEILKIMASALAVGEA